VRLFYCGRSILAPALHPMRSNAGAGSSGHHSAVLACLCSCLPAPVVAILTPYKKRFETMKRWTESDWYVPSDWGFLLGFLVVPIVGICAGCFLPWLNSARRGNPAPFYASVLLAIAGVILLFLARLPLYRQKKFFSFGSRHLSGIHRKLYRVAYLCIGVSLLMMTLLLMMLR
jgi:hypothetical protein